jgi:short-subunit dehydrogenase
MGATSTIARETVRCFAKEGSKLFHVTRNPEKLGAVKYDLINCRAKSLGTYCADLANL